MSEIPSESQSKISHKSKSRSSSSSSSKSKKSHSSKISNSQLQIAPKEEQKSQSSKSNASRPQQNEDSKQNIENTEPQSQERKLFEDFSLSEATVAASPKRMHLNLTKNDPPSTIPEAGVEEDKTEPLLNQNQTKPDAQKKYQSATASVNSSFEQKELKNCVVSEVPQNKRIEEKQENLSIVENDKEESNKNEQSVSKEKESIKEIIPNKEKPKNQNDSNMKEKEEETKSIKKEVKIQDSESPINNEKEKPQIPQKSGSIKEKPVKKQKSQKVKSNKSKKIGWDESVKPQMEKESSKKNLPVKKISSKGKDKQFSERKMSDSNKPQDSMTKKNVNQRYADYDKNKEKKLDQQKKNESAENEENKNQMMNDQSATALVMNEKEREKALSSDLPSDRPITAPKKKKKRRKNRKKVFEEQAYERPFVLDCCNLNVEKLPSYNGLLDRNLEGFFDKPKKLRHLKKMKLIDKEGVIFDPYLKSTRYGFDLIVHQKRTKISSSVGPEEDQTKYKRVMSEPHFEDYHLQREELKSAQVPTRKQKKKMLLNAKKSPKSQYRREAFTAYGGSRKDKPTQKVTGDELNEIIQQYKQKIKMLTKTKYGKKHQYKAFTERGKGKKTIEPYPKKDSPYKSPKEEDIIKIDLGNKKESIEPKKESIEPKRDKNF